MGLCWDTDLKAFEAVEGAVVDDFDAAAVEEEQPQVLAADELVAGQRAQPAAVQVEFGNVHGDALGQVLVDGGAAVDDVGRPRLVVVARAVLRTRHLAVARVKVAAVAQREAVRLVPGPATQKKPTNKQKTNRNAQFDPAEFATTICEVWRVPNGGVTTPKTRK